MGEEREQIVEFICSPDDKGEVVEPEPSSSVMPEWYKKLNMFLDEEEFESEGRTVRACSAFMDALSVGWVLKVESDILIESSSDGVTFHGDCGEEASQYKLGTGELPSHSVATIKIHTSWAAKTPEGYSVMVLPAMNRRDMRYTVISQVVDADNNVSTIDIPLLWHPDSGKTVLEKGTPISQVVAFKRSSRIREALVRPFDEDGQMSYDRTVQKSETNRSWYREKEWQPKGTRMLTEYNEL